MKHIRILMPLLGLIPMLTQAQAPLKDAALERALDGAWCNSDDGGKTCWGYDLFDRGNLRSCGRFPETKQSFVGQSRYNVNGSRVCHVITHSSVPELLKPGEGFCVDVLQIDAKTQTFRDLDTNIDTVVYRVDRKSVKCPGTGA